MAKIPVVDLFAGPGGLGEGFASLSDGDNDGVFNIVLSVEKDIVAHQTLELRSFFRKFSPGSAPEEYYQYLRKKITRKDLFEKYPEESAAAEAEAWCATLGSGDELNNRLDRYVGNMARAFNDSWVLIGGPPCQAYSVMGRARRKKIKGYKPEFDERNFLYRQYLRILAKHQPPVFVMENVKGMLSSKINGSSVFEKILEDLKCPSGISDQDMESSGRRGVEYDIYSLAVSYSNFEPDGGSYVPSDFVIKSEEYGIPQARHRVILLGVKKGLINSYPEMLGKEMSVSTQNVLEGLPPLRSGLSREKDSLEKWRTVVLEALDSSWLNHSFNAKRNLELQENIMTVLAELETIDFNRGNEFVKGDVSVRNDLSWWYLDNRLGGACNHSSKAHMNSDLHRYLFSSCFAEYYGRSPKLQEFPTRLLPDHKNVRSGHFVDRFRVQLADRPSSTITSHIAKDGHYYIHYDPVQCRSLTVREAARLQTFPDNYFFEGNRTQQYIQVGNAVPPLLARKIAVVVRKIILEAGNL